MAFKIKYEGQDCKIGPRRRDIVEGRRENVKMKEDEYSECALKWNKNTCCNYFKWSGLRDRRSNLSMLNVRLFRIVTMNPHCTINVC
jgi:hypothetical protein